MSDVVLSPVKLNLLETIAEREGFTDCEIGAKVGSLKGDGYLGIINTITIHDRNKSQTDLNLILKSSLTSAKLREQAPIRKAYEREIFMYETVFPLLKHIADEHHITNRFNEIARCFGTLLDDGEECIVLENLRVSGYRLWNRMVPMDREHLKLIFKTYGKFHGTSFAVKTLQPERFEGLCKNLSNIFDDDKKQEEHMRMFEEAFKNGFKAVAGDQTATNALMRYTQDLPAYMENKKTSPEQCAVITHGDCWCNNMMFKYEDKEHPDRPTGMRLLDWQISSVDTPVYDLSYFFFASAAKDVFDDLEEFLQIYYDSLSIILKQIGCDPETIFSYQQLKEQWRRHCKFALTLIIMVLKFVLSESEEAPDLSKLADNNLNILEAVVCCASSNEELYLQRIRDVIRFLVDGDYI